MRQKLRRAGAAHNARADNLGLRARNRAGAAPGRPVDAEGARLYPSHMAIRAGDQAPDFTLPKQDGTAVRLADLLQKGPVVLYFYPKDDTPGCTVEACTFRDQYEDFKDAGAEVVGISSDSAADHEAFAKKYELPFLLVADEGGAVRKAYGVKKTFGLLPGRVTYVIDRQGVVRHVFDSQLSPAKHVREALQALK
jgi:peroxiredoxin Q/BCP